MRQVQRVKLHIAWCKLHVKGEFLSFEHEHVVLVDASFDGTRGDRRRLVVGRVAHPHGSDELLPTGEVVGGSVEATRFWLGTHPPAAVQVLMVRSW